MNADKTIACDVCEQTSSAEGSLTKHRKTMNVHKGLRRNLNNEIVFACNVCDKTYPSQKKLSQHRSYSKHTLSNTTNEPAAVKIEPMMETTAAESIYASDGNIRSNASWEKERAIILMTSLALCNVQDAVKQAFRSVRDEMVPFYTTASYGSVEHIAAWERVRKVVSPFENELLMTLLHNTFNVTSELKKI